MSQDPFTLRRICEDSQRTVVRFVADTWWGDPRLYEGISGNRSDRPASRLCRLISRERKEGVPGTRGGGTVDPAHSLVTIPVELSQSYLVYQCCHYTTYKISYIITTGHIWLHVSAVTRPSSGQQGRVLLRYIRMYLNVTIPCWPDDRRVTAETCSQL